MTIKLSLRRKQEPLLLENPETGEAEHFVLREMDGTARDTYLNEMTKRMQSRGGKVQGLTNYTGVQASLIAKCLHRALLELVEGSEEEFRVLEIGEAVKTVEIQKYPSSVQAELFEHCQKMNGFNAKAKEDAQNF